MRYGARRQLQLIDEGPAGRTHRAVGGRGHRRTARLHRKSTRRTTRTFYQLLDEIRQLSQRMTDAERQIIALNPQNPAAAHLQQICGIGPRTACALTACAVDAKYFNSGRQLSAWLRRTPPNTAQAGLVI